jgi:hypothetical protein
MTVAETWLAYAHKGLMIIPSHLRAIPICNLYLSPKPTWPTPKLFVLLQAAFQSLKSTSQL